MLGTPPAFVLSQDQTLKKLYLNNLSVAQIIFQVICSSKFYSRIFVGLNSIFTRNLNNSLIVQGVLSSSSRYSIYKVQTLFSQALARCEPLYISRTFSICQELFSFLFKFLFDSLSFVPLGDNFYILSPHNSFVKGKF